MICFFSLGWLSLSKDKERNLCMDFCQHYYSAKNSFISRRLDWCMLQPSNHSALKWRNGAKNPRKTELMIRWRAKIKLLSVTHHLFIVFFGGCPALYFSSSSSMERTISILKNTVFHKENDWIGLFILFALNTKHVKVTRSDKNSNVYKDFVAFLKNVWLF